VSTRQSQNGFPATKYQSDDIPAEYILKKGSLSFMMVGKIEDPFQGCACSMADITRDLTSKLTIGDKQAMLIDMEAGVESFGRGVERSVDTVLIVVEPSFESMSLAEKINYMADGIGVGKVRAILNKVPSKEVADSMTEKLTAKNVKVLGAVYYDPRISEAGFEGRPLPDSRAKENIRELVRQLFN